MNRQLIIRGVAVSAAAVAASVFVAGQFLGDKDTMAGSVADANIEIRGASIVGPYGTTTLPEDVVMAEEHSALDTSVERSAAPTPQESFQPELTFAEANQPREMSLCDAALTAIPAIDGLIEIRMSAPCAMRERVVIGHGDLAFTVTLDESGVFAAYIPALSQSAIVDAFMSDDTPLRAETQVADFDQYARMIVQWTGDDAVALHAYHRGAQHGEAGHVHAMNPFDPDLEDAFLVSLGDSAGVEPMLAQIYSVPIAQADVTRLQLELEVTEATCGGDMTLYILSSHGPEAGQPQELEVAMPTCGTGEGFVLVDLPFETDAPVRAELEFTSDQS